MPEREREREVGSSRGADCADCSQEEEHFSASYVGTVLGGHTRSECQRSSVMEISEADAFMHYE